MAHGNNLFGLEVGVGHNRRLFDGDILKDVLTAHGHPIQVIMGPMLVCLPQMMKKRLDII